ncbi:hypothetical protein M427DRAFT_139745 [Gonapodya prolifera JEL478]|uniref:Amino acid transporter n=1 Tax=Gonapodya prolifera (strain JEL478) TaxID=1344416 RepID=A0A139A0B3_GONPJ|nr:hypothetical protein M427DRAFT_139745 [Gonapodya prolifera JEL478]|eukprot:KXS10201.1 hypothetical protein M427DRAFT_139745 [Gonapodya prolifera JEL478]
MSTCLSMAEICSTYPTAGGLYYWSAKLARDEWGPYMAWITGCCNILGMPAGSPATSLEVANIVASIVPICNEDFVPSLGWLYGVTVVYAFIGSAANSLGERSLRVFTWLSLVVISTGVIVIGVPLLVMSPTKATASFAFGTFVDKTGWNNSSLVFQLGFLLPMWTFWGYDASAHISEETVDADTTPAKSLIYSFSLSIVIGWIFLLILGFVITDIEAILDCQYNEDLVCVYLQVKASVCIVLIKSMASFLTIWTLFQFIFQNITGHNGASRAIWPAIPQRFAYVHPTTKQPLRTVWLHFFSTAILLLVNFGSTQTVNGFSAFNTIGMYTAYTLPTICKLIWARVIFKPSKINDSFYLWKDLGRFSTIINVVAAAWLGYMIVILSIPRRMPIVRTNLNLSPIMYVGVMLLINVIWFLGAKKTFIEPRRHVTAEEIEVLEKSKGESLGKAEMDF